MVTPELTSTELGRGIERSRFAENPKHEGFCL